MSWTTTRRTFESGFTLVETLVSALLLTVAAAGIAQLTMLAADASAAARARTVTALLAAQKMEQLRSLLWARDADGGVLSDRYTDVSREPFSASGNGLSVTTAGTLERNIDGYVDYLDAAGAWIGGGSEPPQGAVYLRRWAVLALEQDPQDTRVLIVLAATIKEERSIAGRPGPRPRLPEDTILVSLRTRQLVTP